MNTYYYIHEVEPQRENPMAAHASRAAVHIWVVAADVDEARERALYFLASELWDITEEKDAVLLTPERIEAMGEDELSNYQRAQAEGLHAQFYYWHRSE